MNLRPILAALSIACLIGCGPEKEQPKVDSVAPSSALAPPPMDSKPPESKRDTNPNRVYQLADLQKAEIKVDGKAIKVWVMDTVQKTQEGMMFLEEKDVPQDHGMLFLFKAAQGKTNGFWMENTLIGLDILYVEASGKVIDIREGKPLDRTSLKPSGPYQSVIEFKKGNAASLGIKPGSVSLLALVNDNAAAVEFVIDRALWEADAVQAHPLVNTATMILPHADLERFLMATGHAPRVIDIPAGDAS